LPPPLFAEPMEPFAFLNLEKLTLPPAEDLPPPEREAETTLIAAVPGYTYSYSPPCTSIK